MSAKTFTDTKPFILECGQQLQGLQIGYHTFGKLNENGTNVIWVCHALTANSDVLDWWSGLFGEGDLFNPTDHYIVCANILSSCYGTTNPLSTNPENGEVYYLSFPLITIRDMVQAHQILADHLGIDCVDVLIGGSLGGQQAMEWAIAEPDKIKNLVLIATSARQSPWGIAFNESQRLAITADATFYSNTPKGGSKGLKAARSMALLSYRGYDTYERTQTHDEDEKIDNYKAASYQDYQGNKLVKRFNAYSYWYISKAMDSHNVARNRGSVENALSLIKASTLIIGIKSDILFPISEQKYLSRHIPNATFSEFDSIYGHDGFLIETEKLTNILQTFLGLDIDGKILALHTA